jgi:hypothetical protein
MNTLDPAVAVGRLWVGRARDAAAQVESWPVRRILAGLVAVEWLAVLALALTVRHAGWIYYQGGDQLWFYTLGWLLGHGQLGQTPVGYGSAVLDAPLARVLGPNLVAALPAIVLFNVLVLLPAAMLALYGIASRIGGRLFGYWTLVVWIAAPFIGIVYTNAGYHQRYTELTLPQSFGLTAMADFPTMVAALVSTYFVARVVFDRNPELIDALCGGVAAGAAIAFKPATALFLVGPALAFAYRRRLVGAAGFVAGLLPAVLALAVWKERGLGQLPIVGLGSTRRLAGGAASLAGVPLGGIDFGKYFQNLDWGRFLWNLDLLREHFWSARLLEWLVIAGLFALGRRSITALLLVGSSLVAFLLVKGSYTAASVEDSSVFRLLMPSFPAFVLLLASLPLLLPHAPRALREWKPAFAPLRPRIRWTLLALAILVSAVLPLVTFVAAGTAGPLTPATVGATSMPIPANVDLALTATTRGREVFLEWRGGSPFGGPVFFRVWRGRRDAFTCPPSSGGRMCNVSLPEIGVTRQPEFRDRPGTGRFVYRVAVAANWLNDPQYGDPYLVSGPVTARVP